MTRVELYRYLDSGRHTRPETLEAVSFGLAVVNSALGNDPVKLLGALLSGAVAAADRIGIEPTDAIEVVEEILDFDGVRR